MSQSLSKVLLHIIFSTKNRQPFLTGEQRLKTHAYIASIIRNLGGYVYLVGGTEDHVHIATTLPRTISQSDFLKEIKKDSSKWLKTQGIDDFSWQKGYGVFSISHSHLNDLSKYIEAQMEHHRKICFKDELMRFLKKYNVKYDENFLWD